LQRFFIAMNDELRANFFRVRIAERNHLGKLVARINMKQRERNLAWVKGLLRQAQHYRGIFPNRIHHHRVRELGHRFPKDVDALCFEFAKVAQAPRVHEGRELIRARPVSAFDFFRCELHYFQSVPVRWQPQKQKTHLPASLAVGSLTARLD